MPTDVVLTPAEIVDLPAIAEIHLASRQAAGAAFPSSAHPDDEVRSWVGNWDLAGDSVWVARVDGEVVGYGRWTASWLDDLYVLPDAQGHGVGSALLDLAKAQRPEGFGLWVFESNLAAREFYRRHEFVALERTDGSANEERSPDMKLVWPGREPLAYFRSMIDEVDLALGDVLARRAALTRVVQEHKRATFDVADPVRDVDREGEIARRVAAVAPELGEERVARIVHVIITESLDAADPRP